MDGYKFVHGLHWFLRWLVPFPLNPIVIPRMNYFHKASCSGPNTLLSSDGYFHKVSVTGSSKSLDWRMDGRMILDAPMLFLKKKESVTGFSPLVNIQSSTHVQISTPVFHARPYSTGWMDTLALAFSLTLFPLMAILTNVSCSQSLLQSSYNRCFS